MSVEHHAAINETVYHFAHGYLDRMGWFASPDGTSGSPHAQPRRVRVIHA